MKRLLLQDAQIVELYWARQESAIGATADKYGQMLQSLSKSVLHSSEDAEECVNDSYVAAWNSMPSNRPTYLGGYMAKIIRNISLNRIEKTHAVKRSAEFVAYDELCECIPDPEDTESWLENQQLKAVLNCFLASLTDERRVIFLRRYFFHDGIEDIAKLVHKREGNVRAILCRQREQLREQLREELGEQVKTRREAGL